MKKYYTIFSLLILLTFSVNAQWTSWYDSSLVINLKHDDKFLWKLSVKNETENGIFFGGLDTTAFNNLVVGNFFLAKLNFGLSIERALTFPNKIYDSTLLLTYQASQLDNNRILLLSGMQKIDVYSANNPACFTLINADNSVAWSKSIQPGLTTASTFQDAAVNEKGIMCGFCLYEDNVIRNVVFAIDLNGNLIWSKMIGTDSSGIINHFTALPSGNVICISQNGEVYCISMDGNIKWGKHFHAMGFNDMVLDPTKNIVLISQNMILKIDTNGNTIWCKQPVTTFKSYDYTTLNNLSVAPDSGYNVLMGRSYGDMYTSFSDPYYIKLSNDGEIEWIKSGSAYDYNNFITSSTTQNFLWNYGGDIERMGLDLSKSCIPFGTFGAWSEIDCSTLSTNENSEEDYPLELNSEIFPAISDAQITIDTICNEVNFVISSSPLIPSKDEILNLFPNPSHSTLNINTTLASGILATITIYDLLGREKKTEALTSENGSFKISVEDMNGGIYFLKVDGGNETATVKFCKE